MSDHDHHLYAMHPGWCTTCRAEKAEQLMAAEAQHDAEIDNLVSEFERMADDAETLLASLRRTVGKLIHPSVYDIELAEGSEGTDALHELEVAERAIRNVQRIARARRRILVAKEGVPTSD